MKKKLITQLLAGTVALMFFAIFTYITASEVKLTAFDAQAGDQFGYSVSISGDYAIVGAVFEDGGGSDVGAAYIFNRNQGGANNWGEVKKLTASNAQANCDFGWSVSISGDYAIVGAAYEDGGGLNAGAAYIFYRNQGGADNWGQITKISASDSQTNDRFGWTVSISGDYAIVGTAYEVGGGSPTGTAYIYERNQGGANNWGEVTKLTASDAQDDDYFGNSVSISGDYAIVGAYLEDGGVGDPAINAGAAYIYERNQGGANNWGEVTKLTASDAQAGDQFGISISISGDYAIVGAHYEDGETGDPIPSAGAAYIYERNQGGANNWGEVTKLTASDAQEDDYFGNSVSISGDYAIVGAWFEDGVENQSGAAYSFLRSGASWNEKSKLTASDAQEDDYFGISVSISGDNAIVGAHYENGGAGDPIPQAGAAYIYEWVADLSLPVELSSFTANAEDGQVSLKWATQSEYDNLGFIIERSTNNKNSFVEVASYTQHPQIRSQGNSSQETSYHFTDKNVQNGFTYYYKLIDVDFNGNRTKHGPVSATPNTSGAEIVKKSFKTSCFYLHQNYPNPFNPSTTIDFDLFESSFVTLEIYNSHGQKLATLLNKNMNSGNFNVKFDASNFSSGIYYYKIQAGKFRAVKKMLLLQ